MEENQLSNFLHSVQRARLDYNRAARRSMQPRPGNQTPSSPASDAESVRLYQVLEQCEQAVDVFLDDIDDFRYRTLLKLRYVDQLSWPQVLAEFEEIGIFYSDRQLYRLHAKALDAAKALWVRRNLSTRSVKKPSKYSPPSLPI